MNRIVSSHNTSAEITDGDRTKVRDLARCVAEVASSPEMEARCEEWRRHNRMDPGRPMIYIDPQASWGELLALPELLVNIIRDLFDRFVFRIDDDVGRFAVNGFSLVE